jgi:hypothetical protein
MNFRCYEGFSASPAGPSGEFNPDRGHDPGWLCSSVVSNQLPPLATPPEVAEYLHTTTASLAQDRYKGTGPKFIKRGSRVLYRWSDVLEWLDRNTIQRTDDPRQR